MEKVIIKNRHGLKMYVRLTINESNKKLVFLEHGLSARKEYPHMLVLEELFAKHGYNVVNFDATNSLNESESSEMGITPTGHYDDLVDVINWAKTQDFYIEPFALVGQSLGALSVVHYATESPELVNLLIPCAFPFMSGEVELKDFFATEILKNGFYDKISKSTGRVLRMKPSWNKDLENFDLTSKIKNITASTYVIIGTKDTEKHINSSRQLFDLLTCKKQYIELDGIPHDLANTERDKELFSKTIDNILSQL